MLYVDHSVQLKGKKQGVKKAKESKAKSCSLIFPDLLRTDSHRRCHGNVRTSPLLGSRNVFLLSSLGRILKWQAPDSLHCLLHTHLSSYLYKYFPVGLCTVLGRRHCHFQHLFLLVQQLALHKHLFPLPILHPLLCAFLFVAVARCKWSCGEPFSFPCHASSSSVKCH